MKTDHTPFTQLVRDCMRDKRFHHGRIVVHPGDDQGVTATILGLHSPYPKMTVPLEPVTTTWSVDAVFEAIGEPAIMSHRDIVVLKQTEEGETLRVGFAREMSVSVAA